MLADPSHIMPSTLVFEGDKRFFEQALDRAAVVVHGGHSHEQQPNSPKRKRLILTRKIKALTVDPEMPNATLWNPEHASFEEACAFADVAWRASAGGRTLERPTCTWNDAKHRHVGDGFSGEIQFERRTPLPFD